MAGWNGYVDNLMADGNCQDSTVIGKYMWAASPGGGTFSVVTPPEIDVVAGKDRQSFFTNGLVLGGRKCSVIRDSLFVEGDCTIDIRTKSQAGEPTYNVSVGIAGKILAFVMRKKGTHGGILNKKAFTMAKYLRETGF